MLSSTSAGLSSLPSSFSSSEHKSDSSSANSHTLLPQPSSAGSPPPLELSVSSEELANWTRRHQPAQTEPMPWPGRTRSFLRRYSPLVPPAALLIALVVLLVQYLSERHNDGDVSDSNQPVMHWTPCILDANAYNLSAQCATMMMPLCYEGICDTEDDNATIAVSFKRIGANISSISATTVWYLPDRPDRQTRENVDLQMALLYEELERDVDVYTFDMRGTGNSTKLTCNSSIDESPLQTAIFARNDGNLNVSDVKACASRLQDLGYADLSAFSLASASRDVEKVITQFQPGSQVVVYALGYGTLVAQELIQRGVSQVVGFVFDGALGGLKGATLPASSYPISKSDEDFGEVAVDFLTWCQLDVYCSTKFSNASSTMTLNTTIVEVYSRLDADPTSMCAMILANIDTSESSNSAISPPSYALRQLLGLMLKDTLLWPFIPVVVYRFHRCGSEDLPLLTRLVHTTFEIADANTPELVYAIQAFSELWEVPSPSQALLTERFTNQTISSGSVYTQLEAYCLFTSDASCMNIPASTNLLSVRSTLSYAVKPVKTSVAAISSETSLLMLSGGLDALAPLKYATAIFDAFQTPNKALLVVPYGTHGIVQTGRLSNGTACARRVLASYVNAGGNLRAYDASCTAALAPPNLAISMSSSLLVLGVQDAYDGVLDVASISTTSSGIAGVVIESDDTFSNSATSGSKLYQLRHRISTLETIRLRYKVALIVVTSILGGVVVLSVVVMIYQCRRKQQIEGEEEMSRQMHTDQDNELELMRSIYLLSTQCA